ncbi:MAG: hypothetical protein NWQ26_01005, partial [Paraglaciecola sp.]|nr:hypothetical protein [Paraglaciecola sp.]
SNVFNLISEFWDKASNQFALDVEDEVLSACVISHQGQVVHKMINDFYQQHGVPMHAKATQMTAEA